MILAITDFYQNDSSEIDIEIVTDSNSIVNNTINYTEHPSLYPDGLPIPNATLSVPFTNYTTLQTHRFDCTPQTATYYLNNQIMHQDHHNIPHYPGSIQLNLWADGNRLWSGTPSTTNVTMAVSIIDVYYNTSETDNGDDTAWFETCAKAGGPSDQTVCMEGETTPIASLAASTTSIESTASVGTAQVSSTGVGAGNQQPPKKSNTIIIFPCSLHIFLAPAIGVALLLDLFY